MFNPEDRPVTSWAAIAVAGGLTAYGLHGAMKEGIGDVFKLSFNKKFRDTAGKVAGAVKPDSPAAPFVTRNNLIRRQLEHQKGFERAGTRFQRRAKSYGSPKRIAAFETKLSALKDLAARDPLAKTQIESIFDPIRSYWAAETALNTTIPANSLEAAGSIYKMAIEGNNKNVGKLWDAVQNAHKFFVTKEGKFIPKGATNVEYKVLEMPDLVGKLKKAGYFSDFAGGFSEDQIKALVGRGMHVREMVEDGKSVGKWLAFTNVGNTKMEEKPFLMHLDMVGEDIAELTHKGRLVQHPNRLGYAMRGVVDRVDGKTVMKSGSTKLLEMIAAGESLDTINVAQGVLQEYKLPNWGAFTGVAGEDTARAKMLTSEVLVDRFIGKSAKETLRDPAQRDTLRRIIRELGEEGMFSRKPGDVVSLLSYADDDYGGATIGKGYTAREEIWAQATILKDQPHGVRAVSKWDLMSISPDTANKSMYQTLEATSAILPSRVTQSLYDTMGGMKELSKIAGEHKNLSQLADQLLDNSHLDKVFSPDRKLAKEAVQKLIAGTGGNKNTLEKLLRMSKSKRQMAILESAANLNVGQGFIDVDYLTSQVEKFVVPTHLGHEPMQAIQQIKKKGNLADVVYDQLDNLNPNATKFSRGEMVGLLGSGRAARLGKEFDYFTLQKVAVANEPGLYHITALGHVKAGRRGLSYVLTQSQNRLLARGIKISDTIKTLGKFFGYTGQGGAMGDVSALRQLNEEVGIQALAPEEMLNDMSRMAQNQLKRYRGGIYYSPATLSITRLGGTRSGTKVKQMVDHYQLLGDVFEGGLGDRFISELAGKVQGYDPAAVDIIENIQRSLRSGEDTFAEGPYAITSVLNKAEDIRTFRNKGVLDPSRSAGIKYQSKFAAESERLNAILQSAGIQDLPKNITQGNWYYSVGALNDTILGTARQTKGARALSTGADSLLGKIAAGEEDIIGQVGRIGVAKDPKVIANLKAGLVTMVKSHQDTLKQYKQAAGLTGKGGVSRGDYYFRDSTRLSVQSSVSTVGETPYDWIGEVGDEGLERMGVKIRGKGAVNAAGDTIWDAKNIGDLARVDKEGRMYLKGAEGELLASAFASRQPNTFAGMLDLRYNPNLKGFHVATNFSPDQLLMLDRDNDMLDMVLMRSAVDKDGKLAKGANFTSKELQAIFKQQSSYIEKATTFMSPFNFKGQITDVPEFRKLGIGSPDEFKMYDEFLDDYLVNPQNAGIKAKAEATAEELFAEGTELRKSYESLVQQKYFKGGDLARQELTKITTLAHYRGVGVDTEEYEKFMGAFISRPTALDKKFESQFSALEAQLQEDVTKGLVEAPANAREFLRNKFMSEEMAAWYERSVSGEGLIAKFTQMKRAVRAYSMIGGLGDMGESAKVAHQVFGSVLQQIPIKEMKHGTLEAVDQFSAVTDALADAFSTKDLGKVKEALGGMSTFSKAARAETEQSWLEKMSAMGQVDEKALGRAYVEHKFQPVFQAMEKTMSREDFPEIAKIVSQMNRRAKNMEVTAAELAKFMPGLGYNIPGFKEADSLVGKMLQKTSDIAEVMGKSRGVAFAMLAGFGALSLAGALMGSPSGKPLIGKNQLDEQAIMEGSSGQSPIDAHNIQQPQQSFMDRLGLQQNVGQTVQSRGMISHDQSPTDIAGAFRGNTNGNVSMRVYGNHDSRLSIRTRRRIREQ